MAIIKPGPLITELRGQMGQAFIAQENGHGVFYIRRYRGPSTTPNEQATQGRKALATLASSWKKIVSPVDQALWGVERAT